jgi:hypothetical protein
MAQLKDTLINGDLMVTGSIHGAITKANYLTGFDSRKTGWGWGTLTTDNGYTQITALEASAASVSDKGTIAFATKKMSDTSGQLSVQIDGLFYQNEGRYQVLDTSSTIQAAKVSGTVGTTRKVNNDGSSVFDGHKSDAGGDSWVKIWAWSYSCYSSNTNFAGYNNPDVVLSFTSRHTGSGIMQISGQINGAWAKSGSGPSADAYAVSVSILSSRLSREWDYPIRIYRKFTAQTSSTPASWNFYVLANCSDFNNIYFQNILSLRDDGESSFKIPTTVDFCTTDSLASTYGTYVGDAFYYGKTVSTYGPGLTPALPNDTTKFLRGDGSWASATNSGYLPLSGGTMTGVITAKANQYESDGTTGGLNMNNSNITGLNALYTADSSDDATEGIHFYRSISGSTRYYDTLWMSGGKLLFVPNRAASTTTSAAGSYKVGLLPTSVTADRIVMTDDTNGYLKLTDKAPNADKVDGYHVVVGSLGTDTSTLYFL